MLTERDLRSLAAIERHLHREDPNLARRLTTPTKPTPAAGCRWSPALQQSWSTSPCSSCASSTNSRPAHTRRTPQRGSPAGRSGRQDRRGDPAHPQRDWHPGPRATRRGAAHRRPVATGRSSLARSGLIHSARDSRDLQLDRPVHYSRPREPGRRRRDRRRAAPGAPREAAPTSPAAAPSVTPRDEPRRPRRPSPGPRRHRRRGPGSLGR